MIFRGFDYSKDVHKGIRRAKMIERMKEILTH